MGPGAWGYKLGRVFVEVPSVFVMYLHDKVGALFSVSPIRISYVSRYLFPSPAGGLILGPLFSVDNLLQIANLQLKWVLRWVWVSWNLGRYVACVGVMEYPISSSVVL